MIRAKYDSRKLTGRFAQDDSRNSMDVSRKQAAMLCFFQIKFKLLYLGYLIYHLCVWAWALLVADVNLGYIHLSIIVKLTLKFISVTW